LYGLFWGSPVDDEIRASDLSRSVPIAPTPFTEGGDLDLEGQRGALDCVTDQGVDGSAFWPTFRAVPAVGQGARH